jgi:hypothetical protein
LGKSGGEVGEAFQVVNGTKIVDVADDRALPVPDWCVADGSGFTLRIDGSRRRHDQGRGDRAAAAIGFRH